MMVSRNIVDPRAVSFQLSAVSYQLSAISSGFADS